MHCGTRRLDPRPDAETMARYYAPNTYARAEEEGSEVGKRLDMYTKRLADNIAPVENGTALDVGCGDGRFMAALQQRGWKTVGTETDTYAAGLARKRSEATVYETPLPPPGVGPYDLVSLLHVLEHVPDPRETLTQVRQRLRPDGKLLLVLPNADSLESALFRKGWYHLDLPRHLWGFTSHSLVRLVEETGFSVESLTYTPFLFAPQSALRLAFIANGGIPGANAIVSGGGQGGKMQTNIFRTLLGLSDTLGKDFPGEIMELTASVTPGNTSL